MFTVVTLPRYTLKGGNRYKMETCDEAELDAVSTYLPKTMNELLCKNDICDTYVSTPHCMRARVSDSQRLKDKLSKDYLIKILSQFQMTINAAVVPMSTARLISVGPRQCGIRCRKSFQNKVTLLLSRNLRSVLQRPSEKPFVL